MFEPNFRYTDKIVNDLTRIAAARELILNFPLVPKWEVSLRREAIIHSAHSSTAIEGNPLSLEEVSALAEGREIMARRKDKQEVLNYLEALERLPQLAERSPFSSTDLLEVHRTVSKETLNNPADEGVFRNRQVIVGNAATGEVVFRPPATRDVPRLVNGFLTWIDSDQVNKINPVIEAGITHYEMVRIHPFIDGNGRTARVMAALALYRRGFDVKRFFALDDYYDHDRRNYYAALRSVDQSTLDLTDWLEYFTNGVAVSIKAVKDKVIGLSKDIKILKDKGQIALTERQMKIVERIVDKGSITNREVRAMFGITNRPAHDELSKLVEMSVVRQVGDGRSTRYELV